MHKWLLVIVCGCLAMSPAGADTIVSLPQDTTADPAQFVDVCLSIAPLDEMIAADIDIAYDATVLDAVSVLKTTLIQDFSMTYNIQTAGWIRISLFGTQPITGGGCAIVITFETLNPGCALLDITGALINEGETPSQAEDGLLSVYGITDQDGDGLSESAGDCSDRFDWIYPGSVEVCNGADDDCDGSIDEDVVCPCISYVAPRTGEFWERVCLGSSLEDSIQPAYVDLVNDYSTFSAVADADDVCTVALQHGADECLQAEREFMALLLNIASDRLCVEQPIDSGATTAIDVFEALLEIDTLLADTGRTYEDCLLARTVASEINQGSSIDEFLGEEIHMSVAKQHRTEGSALILEAVVVSWNQSDAAAAGRPTMYQLHRSSGDPLAWSQIGESDCHLWFPDFGAPHLPGPITFYQVIAVEP